MSDAQDKAEDEGIFSAGFFTGDNDDIPICVPEDAAPDLDCARTLVMEAYQAIEEHMKSVAPRYDNGLADIDKYEKRVQELEAEGCTRSDAQGIADVEFEKEKTE